MLISRMSSTASVAPAQARGLWTRRETAWTLANVVTVVRLLSCLVIFGHAFATRSATWNFIGLGVYWALDVADGAAARWLDQETRLGAQLDILADRILVCLFYVVYLLLHPGMLVPVLMFLFQFMGIDHYLSNQWMRWPIRSPNYFHLVDRTVWLLNWSPAAKLLNSAVVTLVLVGTGSVWLGASVCAGILALKAWSCVLLARVPPPELAWAPPAAS
jgi:CDP-diacylglycerol--glycerol-3-phosphate 3-phosphatidyltransferase